MRLRARLLLHYNAIRGVGDAPATRLLFSHYASPLKVSYECSYN
jgi:hypothetical protein